MIKVSIIGAGSVGASCAYSLAAKGIANEIVMLDVKKGLAEGKALDMRQSASLNHFDTCVIGVTDDYAATSSSNIIVITSGITRKQGMSRNDLVVTNVGIIRNVVGQVVKYSPEAIIIVVSNPLDVLCYCAFKESGFPANRILGMSGILDIARYKSFIAEELNISVKDVQALILGGHGKTMVPLPRYTTVGGIPIRNLLTKEQMDRIISRTQLGGEELISLLGSSAWYAAGASITLMIEAIILNQRRVLPVCAYMEGQYGIDDIYLGVPAIIGRSGVEKIIELDLDDSDKRCFLLSEQSVRESLKRVM